jgi:hypothetical protein
METLDTTNTEANELVAVFMDLIKKDPNGKFNLPQYWTGDNKDGRKKGVFVGYPDQLKYHSSWNELMPAVEKAAKVYDEDNAPPSKGDVLMSNLMMSLQTFNKLEIFNCLVEFITFRNSNK